MDTTPIKRRLTAILATDAVGYSARMAENEERTLRTLTGHRRIIDGLIADHGGRIVGTAGDSVLAEFGSSFEAVRCAVEIQQALATRNHSLPEAERLLFRIGINLGEVIVEGDDILGDGVNVASRLEGVAEPGGICVSSSVYDQISGKLNLGFIDIGEPPLKNIARPIRAYRVAASVPPQAAHSAPSPKSRQWLPWAVAAAALVGAVVTLYATGILGGQPIPTTSSTGAQATSTPQTHAASLAAPSTQSVSSPPPPAAASPTRTETAAAGDATQDVTTAQPKRRPAGAVRGARRALPAYRGGVAQAWCQRADGRPGPRGRAPVQLVDGEIVIELASPEGAGRISLRGQPDTSGRVVLSGFVVPPAGPAQGTKLPAHYEGTLVDGQGTLVGRQGRQRCSLSLQLK